MKIVYFQSRLGNQMFQYAFFKYLKQKQRSAVYLDATAPYIRKAGKIELERAFPVAANNKYFLPYWKARPFYLLGDVFKKVFHINLQTDIENPIGKKIWWKGYWQEFRYPEQVREELLYDFQFEAISDKNNQNLMRNILNTNSVSIHVRRGDYVQPEIRHIFGDICSPDYYQKAIVHIKSEVKNPIFFIFSDDPQWTQENIQPENAVYINWNVGKNNFRDMHLMSLCKHNIIANSSFSWWGAWLNQYDRKIVISPAKWFQNYPETFIDNLLPPAWRRVGMANPNISLLVPNLTEQELCWLLEQNYGDFEILTDYAYHYTDKRIKTNEQQPVGNHVFKLTKKELHLFRNKNQLVCKLVNYFKNSNI
ncbi:MAG: alpha-1,2-fucosyltransferase [Prevotellaceae bacterium]|jgi:hypothetical protein|nr:alpha-1,2-fucosyltransferase [Prevotellaceae bacterium]